MSPWHVCDDGLELRMRIVAVVAVIAVASTACDESSTTPTTPTTRARVDARVVDSENFKLGVPIPVPIVKGTLSGNFDASIWDGSRWVSLGSPNGITVPLQIYSAIATPVTVHGEQSAPAGSYDRVKLVLQGVTATIASGSSLDRKSTRLNSSHSQISYAVFCLKKKKKKKKKIPRKIYNTII